MAPEQQREVGLAGRYATAIFELAQESKALAAVEQDFAALRRMMQESADLTRLVKSPAFGADAQGKAMKAILEKMDASKLGTQFVLTLCAKRRLFALGDIIAAFTRLVAHMRGEVQAQISSARALSDGELAELRAVLKSKLGREPRLETKVDPNLLGGLVVKVGSRMIDSSLRTKLTGIRSAMRGN